MTAEQQALADAIRAALEGDERIEAAWLSGSLGKGAGDAFSDVDVLALAAEGQLEAASAFWARNMVRIAEPVLVNVLFGGRVLNVVTADWARFDIALVLAGELHRYDPAGLKPLFNRTGVAPPARPERDPYRPSPQALEALIKEFLRVLGLLAVVDSRRDYLNAFFGVGLQRRAVVDLMLEENAIAPSERGGALHLNSLLSPAQLAELEALPPLDSSRESVIATNLALAQLFLPRARRLAAEADAEWPQALEDATRRRLKSTVGMDLPVG
jgi:hypothetical protein